MHDSFPQTVHHARVSLMDVRFNFGGYPLAYRSNAAPNVCRALDGG